MTQGNYPYSYEPIYDSSRRPQQKEKWDVFKNPPIVLESGSTEQTKWIDLGEKAAKILAYIVTFVLILGGAVLSKGTIMFMIAQMGNNQTNERPFCNRYLDRNKQYHVVLPREERLAWMWMIMFAFFVPQLGTFIRSARILIYKSWDKPKLIVFAWVFVSESLMTIGIAIFVYIVLPSLDSVKGLMLTNAVCFVPGVLAFAARVIRKMRIIEFRESPHSIPILILDFVSVLAQASAFILWPLTQDNTTLWFTIASAILISCGWWENFVPLNPDSQRLTWFENSRYFIYVFASWWKCLVFFVSMVVIEWVREGEIQHIFDDFLVAFQEHNITLKEVEPVILGQSPITTKVVDTGGIATIASSHLTPIWVFLINVLSTYLCYIVGKWACKINIQGFSYSFPINLTVPVALSILISMCSYYMENECTFHDTIPLYLFFQSPTTFDLTGFLTKQQSWIWLVWLLSQAWITAHTWIPKCEKLAKTEKLYVRPMYEPFLIDQDLALNRRVDDGADWRDEECDDIYRDTPEDVVITSENFNNADPDDSVTRIYACATMWHETEDEMIEFLKSIFRMDEDQCARRTVREQLGFTNRADYYEFETHIFFDDAFIRRHENDNDPQINEFVKMLAKTIDKAASIVHEVDIRLRAPKVYATPYGGRLVWTLPGKTKMIAHLKDAKKIRKKKRWSQVMYMYYLLGHRLMERRDISGHRKDVIGENTFILALDGDIDFQPKAVHLLVELMKKNKNLGAACGRIHPMGSGPLVWYQMFEYAIGHWMQKATEHIIGCVLCSPGCFSLFRGKALMDDSVMCKYTLKATQARHFVQYDQGEDRWLCTLLLQRGYRVEYAAASDAYTHCPEGFKEFYNQRRRWMPSTTANILDLLMSYKYTVKINDNISTGYIWYQFLLLFGTILGPGTIFLMLIGSFVAVFQWSQWTSFLYNAVPLMIFVVTCFLFSGDKIQLFVAGILSGVYALVMMAVLVGVLLQTTTDGWLAPSSLFFFCMIGGYVVTALLHPKELGCLKFGLVYYVTIPSMYMLLVIYSVFNMNNVSWGTREVTIVPNPQDPNSPTAEAPKKEKKKKNKIISWLGAKDEDNTGAIEFSIASLFKCLWCTRTDDTETNQLAQINKHLAAIHERLDLMEGMELDKNTFRRPTIHLGSTNMQQRDISTTDEAATLGAVGTGGISNFHMAQDSSNDSQSFTDGFDIPENNWMDDEVLQRGEHDYLHTDEEKFWNGILDKYLHPVDDEKDKPRIAKDLKDLRDKIVLAFFMINALFVLVIFLLTLNKDTIFFEWPFGYHANFTYMDDINQVWIYKEYLQLEPIGIVFLALFASLIIIQFIGMLLHRFQTFTQIVANTNVVFWTRAKKKLTDDEMLERNPVEVAKKLQKLKGAEDGKDVVSVVEPARRKTVAWLDQGSAKSKEVISDLDVAFQRRVGRIASDENYKGAVRRGTVLAIRRRQSKIIRPSGLQNLDGRPSHLINLDQQNSSLGPMGQTNLGYADDSTI